MAFKKILITGLLLSLLPAAYAQNKIDEALKDYYSLWAQGKPVYEVSSKLLTFDSNDVFSEVERFSADTLSERRYATYQLIEYLGTHYGNDKSAGRAIRQLVIGSNDRDGGIVGACLKSLQKFTPQQFEPEVKYLLSEQAKRPQQHYEDLIKLCGWLQITDLIYPFKQMIADKKGDAKARWAMRLAMARMGDTEMLAYCQERIKSLPVGDDLTYDVLPDIIYTRKKPLFDYLITIIESNEKNCTSPNPDSDAKILCAFRVISHIAPYIKNFPVEVSASGDLKTKDYDKTLQDVRSWIKENNGTYQIIDHSF